jgi:hypothetical protein
LAIAHQADGKTILDLLRQWKAPFSPALAIDDMADLLTTYHLRGCTGDRYAGEFVTQAFGKHGITYRPAEKSKSELYLDFLGRLCSQQVELLDDEVLIKQLASLERRTRSGGRDIVDHPPGCRDDCANCAAGVTVGVSRGKFQFGFLHRDGMGMGKSSGNARRNRLALGRMVVAQRGRY